MGLFYNFENKTKQKEQWNQESSPEHHPVSRTCGESTTEQAVLGKKGKGQASTAMFNVILSRL